MEAKTQAKAILRYARISPRKVNIVTDLIRNKNVATARGILMNTPKAASELLINREFNVFMVFSFTGMPK